MPVVHPRIDWSDREPDVAGAVAQAALRMDLDTGSDRFAVALDDTMPSRYWAVQRAASELARFYRQHGGPEQEALVVVHKDLGKVLGMELQPLLPTRPLAVIDEVVTRDGDYIDIGQAYFGGAIVPLTVKSLAFPA